MAVAANKGSKLFYAIVSLLMMSTILTHALFSLQILKLQQKLQALQAGKSKA